MKFPGVILLLLCLCFVVSPASGQELLFNENFAYPAGDCLTAHGWMFTGTPNYADAIVAVQPGLTFGNFAGSGVGNAAALADTGQDVNRALGASVSSGDVFIFVMVKVTCACSGDYFFHLIEGTPASVVFSPRIYAKDLSGHLAFGIAKQGEAPAYTDAVYDFNTTYLLAIKYTFVPGGSTNDLVSLTVFTNPDKPIDDPATPTVGPVGAGAPDAVSLDLVGLRQGSGSPAPKVVVDGIRVATSWTAVLPIQLSSFKGVFSGRESVSLTWTTLSEVNNYGFEVERAAGTEGPFSGVSELIPGHNTTVDSHEYSYIDRSVPPGVWFYRLKSVDLDQSLHYSEPVRVEVVTGIAEAKPARFELGQNYPNPFNPATTITFSVASTGRARLQVFNLLGQHVATVFDGIAEAGRVYSVRFDGASLPTGMYLYKLQCVDRSITKQLALIR